MRWLSPTSATRIYSRYALRRYRIVRLFVIAVGPFDCRCADRRCEIGKSCSVENDAHRQQIIALIAVLPEVASEVGGDEEQHVGFSVRKKRFAWYLDDHHGDGIVAVTCKAPLGANTELAAAEPDRFFIPAYTGKKGWLAGCPSGR